MDAKKTSDFVGRVWNETIVPTLTEYIQIPNKSPNFDPQWQEHGHMDRAVELIASWCRARKIEGMKLEVVRLPGRTPLIYMEIPGNSDRTVLLYGHLDKQPEMTGWEQGLGPWTPVRRGERLYGRGGADDGYAAFASLTAIEAVRKQDIPHARCVVIIEACEESGSFDLPPYIDALKDRIGSPELVICLDSGCGNYEQLWLTTSLRGNVVGILRVEVLREGVHSGDASGVVASSFRIIRQLLDRVEDSKTGRVLIPELSTEVPPQRVEQARATAKVLGDEVYSKFPLVPGMKPMATDPVELILNRTWRPFLAVTGADGIPLPKDGGNVLRPYTTLKLSMRTPPTTDVNMVGKKMKEVLERDPPYGAKVSFDAREGAQGWSAPPLSPWLEKSIQEASQAHFGKPAISMGEGGTIPFMAMLGAKFPRAQFLITGVLGPGSNAHGPNEFLDIPTGKKLTACVARVLADHSRS